MCQPSHLGHALLKRSIEIWNSSIKYELNCQWDRANIDDRYSVCITVEYLSKNRAKDDFCFLERCSLLCWILSIRPLLLAVLHFGIASLQYPHQLSVGCMQLYGTQRYIHRLQLSRNLQDSPGFLQFVPGPGTLRKLSRKSPYPRSLPRKPRRKCNNYAMLWRTIFKVALVRCEKLRTAIGKGVKC